MRKTGFSLHRMLCLLTLVAAFSVFLPLASFAATATASTGIQMLPPVINGTTTACDTANGGVLQWGGIDPATNIRYPITCVPQIRGAVTADPKTGLSTTTVTINGAKTNVGGGLAVTSGSSQFSNTVSIGNLAGCGKGNVGADTSGTLHCCPGGTVVTAADSVSVTCGPLSLTAVKVSGDGGAGR